METARAGIYFPVVGGGVCKLIKIICFRLRIGDTGGIAVLPEGTDGHGNDIINLLTDIRSTELENLHGRNAAAARSAALPVCLPVCIGFCPPGKFCGNSFSLALAIADKRARYGGGKNGGGAILATGIIQPGSHGLVEKVEGFDAKFTAMATMARPGDTIIVPSANLMAVGGQVECLWRDLIERKVNCRAVEQLDDVNFLWNPGCEPRSYQAEHILTGIKTVLQDFIAGMKSGISKLSLLFVHAIASVCGQEVRRGLVRAGQSIAAFVWHSCDLCRAHLGAGMLVLVLGAAVVWFTYLMSGIPGLETQKTPGVGTPSLTDSESSRKAFETLTDDIKRHLMALLTGTVNQSESINVEPEDRQ